MKERITCKNGMYFGEIYGIWEIRYYGILLGSYAGWKKITSPCFTYLGAKLELIQWKRKTIIIRKGGYYENM